MPSKVRHRGNNTYEIAAYIGYDENGKQLVKRKSIKAKNVKEAQKAQIAFENDLKRGDVTLTGKMKLGAFAKKWFREHCEKKLAPKTQQSYRNHLNNRILPALGHIDINNLKPQHIIDFVNDMSETGERFDGRKGKISSESMYYSFRVLSSMLQDAIQWQIIPNNPCQRVEAPKVNRKKIKILDEDSIAKMIGLLANEPLKYRTILMLAIDSGLRLGEIMGLKWVDINFSEASIKLIKR